MMTGPDNLGVVRASMQRLTSAAEAILAPGERLTTTGIGWAAPLRPRVPVLFLGRRQHWFALTDRRVLVFARHRGGPGPEDLVLGKRYSFFTLEKVHRNRPLFQIRIRGSNDSRLVLEFRPGQRSVAAELVARLTRALPPARSQPSATAPENTPGDAPAATPPSGAEPDADRDTAAAFWGEH
jgi:hypothetical protein